MSPLKYQASSGKTALYRCFQGYMFLFVAHFGLSCGRNVDATGCTFFHAFTKLFSA